MSYPSPCHIRRHHFPYVPYVPQVESVVEAAAVMAVPDGHLREQLRAYAAAAAGGEMDSFGKRVFPHPPDPEQQLPMYVAQVTPVVSAGAFRRTCWGGGGGGCAGGGGLVVCGK